MLVLALDTATPTLVAGVARWSAADGAQVLAERAVPSGTKHAELLTPAIRGALADAGVTRADLQAVVVGLGPGPFTGLRVGVVTAAALGDALGLPVVGVCSLDAVGSGARTVVTDARRKEVYWASYDEQGVRLDGPHVDRPADVATDRPVIGAGALLYPEAFPNAVGPAAPDARVLAQVVTDERVELLDPEPLYLRRPDAAMPGKPKPVS